MLNRITISGRMVRDPELRKTQSGRSVANFTLACERDFKDSSTGQRPVDFIDVVAWGTTGEFVSRWFARGQMAIVDGRLEIRSWTDKNGNKRIGAEINASSVYFADSKREDVGSNSIQVDAASYNEPEETQDQFSELTTDDSNLPF